MVRSRVLLARRPVPAVVAAVGVDPAAVAAGLVVPVHQPLQSQCQGAELRPRREQLLRSDHGMASRVRRDASHRAGQAERAAAGARR